MPKHIFFKRSLALCAALCVLTSLAACKKSDAEIQKQNEIQKNVSELRQEENQKNVGTTAETGDKVTDLAAEQEKIMALKGVTNEILLKRWREAAIAGDSVVDAILEYDLLDKSKVFAKIGISVKSADEVIQRMEAVQPGIIFLAFGLNDMELYKDKTERFIKDYTACIEKIKQAVPMAKIYVCAITPVTEAALKKTPDYANRDAYNAALKEMCKTQSIDFLDASFILEQNPKLFDKDGIHPKKSYYPRWLTFLADMAGVEDA